MITGDDEAIMYQQGHGTVDVLRGRNAVRASLEAPFMRQREDRARNFNIQLCVRHPVKTILAAFVTATSRKLFLRKHPSRPRLRKDHFRRVMNNMHRSAVDFYSDLIRVEQITISL